MTTPASPNPLSFSQLNTELGNLAGGSLSMSNAKLKTLLSDWSNPILLSNGRAKTWPLVHASTYLYSNPALNPHSVTVPAGASFVSMKMWGGGGGSGPCVEVGYASGGGGPGAFVWTVGACTPGEILTVVVGGAGGAGLSASASGGGGGGASYVYNATRGFYYDIAPGGGGGGATGTDVNDVGGPGGNGSYNDGVQGLNGGALGSSGGSAGDKFYEVDGGYGGVNSTTPAYSGTAGTFLQGGLGGHGAYAARPSNGGIGGGGAGGTGSLSGGVVGGGAGGGGAGYFGGGGGAYVVGSGGGGGGGGSFYGWANTQIFTALIGLEFNGNAIPRGNTMTTYPASSTVNVNRWGNYPSFAGIGGAGKSAVGNGNNGGSGSVSLEFFTA